MKIGVVGDSQAHLTAEQASLLLACGEYWPHGLIPKDVFLDLLAGLLGPRGMRNRLLWEKQLAVSCSVDEAAMVDVRRFVSSLDLPQAEAMIVIEDEEDGERRLDPEDAEQVQRRASAASVEGAGRGGERTEITLSDSWSLSTATIKDATVTSMGEARRLPPTGVEVDAGTTIEVGSQDYVIVGKLGGGGFGVVHEVRLVQRRTEEDAGGVGVDPHRPPPIDPSCNLAMKLAGSIGAEGYLNVDLKLAAMAVEAAAAAEVRRLTRDKVTKWEGKVFLPVLHSVGRVASVGGINVRSMAALVMEKADGTLRQKSLSGEALNRVAWALATTVAALNRAGFIHGDLKPSNVLWKKMPTQDGVTDGWPLLTDFGASQSFRSFTTAQALSPSDGIRTSAWTREYAAPEVHACNGSKQTIKSDMYAWAMTLKRVASTPVLEPLTTLLEECLAEDPCARPRDFMEISGRLEAPSCATWGRELAKLQFGEELSVVKQSYETALQAASFLAQERETWMSLGLCSREEAADAYFFVNVACFRSDKPDGQLQALQRSIQLCPKHATRPAWLHDLGNAYGALGDYGKSRDCLEKVLRIDEAQHGPEHVQVASTLTDLGNAYGDLGDYAKQRDYLEKALRLSETHYGLEH
eukprot:6097545-Amphidinium_carterae.1